MLMGPAAGAARKMAFSVLPARDGVFLAALNSCEPSALLSVRRNRLLYDIYKRNCSGRSGARLERKVRVAFLFSFAAERYRGELQNSAANKGWTSIARRGEMNIAGVR